MSTSGPESQGDSFITDIFGDDFFNLNGEDYFDLILFPSLNEDAFLAPDLDAMPATQISVSIRTSSQTVPGFVPDVKKSKAKRKYTTELESDDGDYILSESDQNDDSRITQLQKAIEDNEKELQALNKNSRLSEKDLRRERNRISAAISRRKKEINLLCAKDKADKLEINLIEARKEIKYLKNQIQALQTEIGFLKGRLEGAFQETAVVVTVSSPTKKGVLPQFKRTQFGQNSAKEVLDVPQKGFVKNKV
ncbi:MAG: hypothetical protein AB7V32_02830 [Candidatus Berkiella sp.]